MADGELTMFGKAYDTVGSTNKNLVLLTRGDLKVRWGNKYIDLIKNGKINVDTDLLKKVNDSGEIIKDGIYLIEKENNNEIWLSIGGTTLNIFGEVSDNYVAFVKELDVDALNRFRALSNIGFYYESLEKAQEKQLKQGLVFILNLNKIYYVDNGEFKEYTFSPTLEIPNPLKLDNLTINGTDEGIVGNTGMYFNISNIRYLTLGNDAITTEKQLITKGTISSDDFLSGLSGFSIYTDDKNYIGEFDVIKVRKSIIYEEILNVTYDELRALMEGNQLYAGKLYRITDFFNEWDYYQYDLTAELGDATIYEDPSRVQFYFPVIVTASSKGALYKEGYFCENKNWVIQYDPTFNYLICEAETEKDGVIRKTPIYARGRITKLTDEYGNTANYDFKHRLFKYNLNSDDRKLWVYTFNKTRTATTSEPELSISWEYIHDNWDASADGNIINNIVNLPEPELENYTLNGETVLKVKITDDYFLFDCSTLSPYNNTISHSSGLYYINTAFHDNTFINLEDCQVTATITNCSFGNTIGCTILGTLDKCVFEGLTQMEIGKANQTLSNITVTEDLTSNSALWVQQRLNPSVLLECNPLKINSDDVPRLAESAKKECFIKVITKDNTNKTTFYVLLTSDDNTPSGVILMWYGDANSIPNGYVICDGTNGTPNLSDRFIKATTSNVGPVDNNDTEVVDNVKTNRIKLSSDNLPKHTHSLSGVTIENASTNEASEGTAIQYATGTNEFTPVTSSSTPHTHTFSSNATTGDGDFLNTSFNIEPQAFALIFIMKL